MGSMGIAVVILILVFLVPALFMWLWNMTCPEVFHLPEIRYWQAFRLLILASLLFGVAHLSVSSSAGPILRV